MRKDFFDNGFTNVLKIDLGNTLTNLQNKIYSCTKEHIIDHDSNLPLVQKIKLPFKKIPDKAIWSRAMSELNNSPELEDIINSIVLVTNGFNTGAILSNILFIFAFRIGFLFKPFTIILW